MAIPLSRDTGLSVLFIVLGLVGAPLLRPNYSLERSVPATAAHVATEDRQIPDQILHGVADADNYHAAAAPRGLSCYFRSEPHLLAIPSAGGGADSVHPWKVPPHLRGKGLYLLAQPDVVVYWNGRPGMRVLLVNATGESLAFATAGPQLPVVQEALDEHGRWRPVETAEGTRPASVTPNIFLAPYRFWHLAAPRYRGEFATKLRFKLLLSDGTPLVSNEFDGSVNPGQFYDVTRVASK